MLLLIILGLVLGFSTSYLGTGSSLFLIPLLPVFVEISPAQVVATAFLVTFALTSINCISYIGKPLVLWPVLMRLGGCSIITAGIVASIAVTLDERIFRVGLAGMLTLTLISPQLKLKKTKTKECALGILWGTLNAISGLGGSLATIIYFKLNWINKKNIVPTINAIMCIMTFVMLWSMQISYFYSKGGSMYDLLFFKEAGLLVLGSLPGGVLGRRLNLNDEKEQFRHILLKVFIFCLLIKVLLEFASFSPASPSAITQVQV